MRAVRKLFQADGRTDGERERDMTNLIRTFRNFANAPKNLLLLGRNIKMIGCVSLC